MNRLEASKLGFGIGLSVCICSSCNEDIFDNIYYIAVLHDVMCEACYEEWYENATYYEEDTKYENINFEYYAKKLNLI